MERIKKLLKWIVPLILGVLLFAWIYRRMDWISIKEIFQLGLRYEWMLAFMLIFIGGMVARGLRWQQLLEPVCPETETKTTTLAVFVAYAANLIFPRIGEVARCGLLKQYKQVSFTKALGTVLAERIIDLICLLIMVIVIVVFQLDVFRQFFTEYPDKANSLMKILFSWQLWAVLFALVLVIILLWRRLRKLPLFDKFNKGLEKLWLGMKSIKTLKRPWLFIFWSIFIWLSYFATFYIGQYFFNIPFGLGIIAMFTAHIMGSLGMVAPVQGGLGAWHFMVIYTMVLYGISETAAGAFALTVHGFNTILTLFFGLIAYLWLLLENKKSRAKKSEEAVKSN
ncbi:MAG: lysylphosphatidylglycerol synthase transmembrane domain-containing protein [Bacteroidales bacterium]|nr:lysylphosphatidylglycerol synthase transmembrane domain-containing protein [Bacteroidales bacterium]MDD3430727.1 lysylphosphatidylglycerol synthase transmembrane domain-containing protein [Bacteroidales bacterium]MDD4361007.1 lysylphosphatidylglycerol synthase transmembrane domain-containing protein [Bacteroidales bacterium]